LTIGEVIGRLLCDPMLVEVARGLLPLRGIALALGFGLTMRKAIARGANTFVASLGALARRLISSAIGLEGGDNGYDVILEESGKFVQHTVR